VWTPIALEILLLTYLHGYCMTKVTEVHKGLMSVMYLSVMLFTNLSLSLCDCVVFVSQETIICGSFGLAAFETNALFVN